MDGWNGLEAERVAFVNNLGGKCALRTSGRVLPVFGNGDLSERAEDRPLHVPTRASPRASPRGSRVGNGDLRSPSPTWRLPTQAV